MSNLTTPTGTTGAPVPPRPPRLSPLRKALIAAAAIIGIAAQVALWNAPTTGSTLLQPSTSASASPSQTWSPNVGTSNGGTSSNGSSSSSSTTINTNTVVLVNTKLAGGSGAGTGMIVDSSGIIMTNYHVVQGSTSVQVTLSNGQVASATVLGFSPSTDIAVLKVAGASNLPTITASSNPATIGQAVTTVGNANGQGYLTGSTGQVVATDRTVTVGDTSTNSTETLSNMIATSTAAVPGDSGGPTFDAQGNVVGVTTAGSTTNQVTSSQATGGAETFVIPISRALSVVSSVLSGQGGTGIVIGPRPWLGVSVVDASNVRGGYQSTVGQGAVVISVEAPAQGAGIVPGDTIVAVDSDQVTDPTSLSSALIKHKPGDTVTVTVASSAGTQQVQVTLQTSSVN